jgi:hypothetical protein
MRQLEEAVAFVGNERVDVDERLDVGQSSRGVGDDEASVGMRGEHDRTLDRLEEHRYPPDVGSISISPGAAPLPAKLLDSVSPP